MKADINVTPLIDVLLVLLIIFIVVTPVAPRALDAALPPTHQPTLDPAPAGLLLEVRADDFTLNSTPVLTLHDLDERLRTAFEIRREPTLLVHAADDISCARLVAAVDVAKGAGAARIGLVER